MLKGYAKSLLREELNQSPEMAVGVEFQIDNRDIGTTWLTLPDGNHIEVDPWELLENALENANRDDLLSKLAELKSLADTD